MASNNEKEKIPNPKKIKTIAAPVSGNNTENTDSPLLLNKESSIQIYKCLINNSTSAIFLNKVNGQIIEVNNTAENLFGYSKEEFLQLGRQGIMDYSDENLEVLLDTRNKTGKVNGELTGIKKSGIKFPVEFTSSVFNDHFGEEFTCTILQDITERKNIEQQMLLMLNNTDESFILLDKELIILNFNKQFNYFSEKLFNVAVEKGKHILNYAQPERVNIANDIFKKVLNGEVVYAELPVISLHGIENYFAIKYTPSKDTSGELVGIFITIRDITDEKNSKTEIAKQQALLEQAEANYREIFENANDAVFIHELETGKLIDVNKKGCELYGINKNEILAADPAIFLPEKTGFTGNVIKEKLKLAAEGKPQLYEWITRHNNGTLNWVEVSLQKATIAGSEKILAYYRLINDRKNAEVQAEIQRRDKEALINTTDDLIWSIDCELKLIAANNAYLAMVKSVTTIPHKIGDTVLIDEFGEALNTKWKAYYQRALGGEKYTIEEQFYDPATKSLTYGLISFNPIFLSNKKITGVACYSKNITELTENQLAVKATKAELDNVMASSLDMICSISENNRIERISAACEIILGYKPEELIGKNLFDFIYPEDEARTMEIVAEVMEGKINTNYYNRYIRKDGSLVYLEWTSKWNEQAKMRYGVGRDISTKVEAEKKLKLSHKRYRSLVQDGSDMITILDEKGKFIYASPTTLSVMGYINEDFTDKSVFNFIHVDDVKAVQYDFNLLNANNKIILPPFRFKHKNETWRWIETSLTNLLDEEAVNGIVANSRDVTERKNIEEALLATKENYKNLFENSPAPMFIFDFKTLQIIDCNEETLLKYGYSKEEFLQLTIKDIRPKEDIAKINKAVESEEAYGEIHKKIWRHKKKNGEIIYMDITGHLINYNGKRVSLVMLIDVTEKLKAEELRDFEKRDKEALINNTEDLIWSVSKDYKLIAANNAFINYMDDLCGISLKAGDNIMLEEYFPAEFLDFWKNCYKRTFAGEAFKKEVHNAAFRDRTEAWLEINFNPIFKGIEVTGVACNARNVTDSKRAAEELQNSEEKYRLLFYNSPIPKLIYDIETLNIVEVNGKAVMHYGYTREEFLKINIKNLRSQENLEKFDEIINNGLKNENYDPVVVTHVKKNGEQIKVEVSGHKIFYESKNCMMAICIDVTEKEAALQVLKDKDAQLENAQQIAKLGYWQLNLNTQSLFWSKELYKIWGINQDVIPDFNLFISTVHPDDKSHFIQTQNDALHEEKDLDIEHRIILPDGTVKWIHEKGRFEKSLNADVNFLTGTAQDITERKNAEEIIKLSNERYEHVTKATYDAIWEWDIVNNTTYRAEGFERSFGFNLTDLNKPETLWENFIHADDRAHANESIQSAIKSNKDYWSCEYRIIKPNGENAHVEDRAYILRNAAGEAQRVIGALRDITERKYYYDLEILDRDVLEKNAQAEKSIEEVIEKYIIGIQKLHPGMLCSMQTVKNNRLYNLASPDLPEDYLAAIYGLEIGNNMGSCGTAAFLKEKIIVTDIATDIRWAKYTELAAKAGLKACWSYPIFDSKHNVVATFAIYYTTIRTPTAQEENIIKRAGNILQTILESHSREAALQESNERYLNVTKATFDAIWDWDIASNNVYWGETYRQLFGNFEDAHLTDTEKVIARLHPDERESLVAGAAASLEGTDINWALEHRYLKEDNTYAYVLNKALIVRDETGSAIRVFGAMQDITRQKQEEQRLKLMSSVVTSTNDAVLITEVNLLNENERIIVFANEAFTKMTGYTETELIGNSPRILRGPKTDKEELKRLEMAFKKLESCEITIIHYKKNGEEFWSNFTITPITDEKGRYTHWISIERDVTDRKNDELQKELLRKIRIIFNAPIGINETMDKVLKEVTIFGHFCFAESWLLSADKKEIKRATYYVNDPAMRSTLSKTSKLNVQNKGEGLVGIAWETQELQVWDSEKNVENILAKDVLINAGVKKLYALPFSNNAEIIGVIVFGLDKPEPVVFELEKLFFSLRIYLGAEIKRKQLEQELNQIFNFAPDIIAIVGKDGFFKKLNPAASDLLEYSPEELMEVPFIEFIHPEDKNKTVGEFNDIKTGKTTFYFENRYITKSGKIKWLAWTSTPSQEEEVIFAVGKNITEKKDLEVVLNKANNLARIGSWEMDLENDTLYWSEMTKEIHEADFIPSLEQAINVYKEGKNRDQMVDRVEEAKKYGTAWDVELKIITENGNERWVRSIGETEFIKGKCVKVYGSLQDINERKRAEENIRSSEERRELIMNAALDAIICIDKSGNVTFWNPQAEFIFGWTETEVMGKNFSNIIVPTQYKARHENGMENYFKNGTGQALNVLVQFSALRKNGEEFPIELTVLPIEQDGEKFFCGFVRDITERKISENRLLELNHSLQKQTHELAAINKELEQFAYVASHDLQEPLRMVTSFITQLEKRYENVLDEKGKKYIYFAVDGARRMRLIILDLLEYSKIGRIDELKENIDLNEIVDEIKILYSNKIEEQQAIIITKNLPVIPSYKSPVRQVFQNIISNSLKYCKDNNPCNVVISAEDIGTHWHFSITDNGIGIHKDYFDKIFIIFQRLHTKEAYSGTGMGLAVTKKIIENLQGKIWVESIEGEGSVFHFTLPGN